MAHRNRNCVQCNCQLYVGPSGHSSSRSALLRGLDSCTEGRPPMSTRDVLIYDTHRGLLYEDGRFLRVLEAGRYRLPRRGGLFGLFGRARKVEIRLVDVRERDLTIKGQEILTADKVSLRVSILVQFRVADPRAALHEVENYQDRLYSDVQLAARRSLAAMT